MRGSGTLPRPGAAATTIRSRRSTSLAVSRVAGSCRSSPSRTGASSPARSGASGGSVASDISVAIAVERW
ncbi:hypothetical protein [Paractinoplanes durhamensis]|uniref:hypothetical protein n=1 Tax=Paractinoplanes durhamensis TaxID=113563 RepID=UPI0036266864